LAGALERLRDARIDEIPVDGWTTRDVSLLAAADPANPFGALLPWPKSPSAAKPKRIGGAWTILVAGQPVLYLSPNANHMISFPESIGDDGTVLDLAMEALGRIPRSGRRRLLLRKIDGRPATDSPLGQRLLEHGFEADYDALARVVS
jgi:ATP-dependent Lhr-like helicase